MIKEIKLIVAIFIASLAVLVYAAAEAQKAQETKPDEQQMQAVDEERNIFDEDVKEGMQEKILEFIDRTNPGKGRELREMRETNPEQFEKEIADFGSKMREKFSETRKKAKEPDAVTRATNKGDWKPSQPQNESQRPEQGRKGKDGGFADQKRMGPAKDSYMEVMRKRNEEFIEWLKINYPQQAMEFEKASEANPERAFRDLMPVMMKYRDIFETEKKNPELASLMKKDVDLLERQDEILKAVKNSEDQKIKDDLIAELRTITEARFDLILKKRQMRFDELKERLAQLEKEITKQEADLQTLSEQRDIQIQKRIDELLADDNQVKWN